MVWSELASHFWSCPLGHRACSQGPGLTLRKIRNILSMTLTWPRSVVRSASQGRAHRPKIRAGGGGISADMFVDSWQCLFLMLNLPSWQKLTFFPAF